MSLRDAPWAAATLLLLLALAACGEATHAALDPGTPSSEPPSTEPSAPAATPTWGGCTMFSTGSIDYISDAGGQPTREQAAQLDPGHQLVPAPESPHRAQSWYVVDADGLIHRELTFQQAEGGWLVESITDCAE